MSGCLSIICPFVALGCLKRFREFAVVGQFELLLSPSVVREENFLLCGDTAGVRDL